MCSFNQFRSFLRLLLKSMFFPMCVDGNFFVVLPIVIIAWFFLPEQALLYFDALSSQSWASKLAWLLGYAYCRHNGSIHNCDSCPALKSWVRLWSPQSRLISQLHVFRRWQLRTLVHLSVRCLFIFLFLL